MHQQIMMPAMMKIASNTLQMYGCYSYCYGEIADLPNPPNVTRITATKVPIDLTTRITIITPLMYAKFNDYCMANTDFSSSS